MNGIESIDPAESVDLRRAVLRAGLDHPPLGDRPDQYHVGVHEGGRLVATGNIGPDQKRWRPGWRIRGMAVDPSCRGRGLGTRVLGALLVHAEENGGGTVWCHARPSARSLYERAGFSVVGEEWDDPEIGPHVRMERRLKRRRGFLAAAYGVCFVLASIMMAVAVGVALARGDQSGPWVWLALVIVTLTFLAMGLSFLGRGGRLLPLAAIGGAFAFMLVLGLLSLLTPDAFVVPASGRGPHSVGAARLIGAGLVGVVLVVAGFGVGGLVHRWRRRATRRSAPPE